MSNSPCKLIASPLIGRADIAWQLLEMYAALQAHIGIYVLGVKLDDFCQICDG